MNPPLHPETVLAILGYIFLIAMTVTSFHRPAALLGRRWWQILHTTGMYYFWLAFTAEFIVKIPQSIPIYLPYSTLLVVAIMLRLFAMRNRTYTKDNESRGNS